MSVSRRRVVSDKILRETEIKYKTNGSIGETKRLNGESVLGERDQRLSVTKNATKQDEQNESAAYSSGPSMDYILISSREPVENLN